MIERPEGTPVVFLWLLDQGTIGSGIGIRGRPFQAHDRQEQQYQETDPTEGNGFVKQHHAQQGGSSGPDADPYGIGGSHRQSSGRQAEQIHADGQCGDGKDGWPQAGEALGVFEPNGPCGFKQPRHDQKEPGHAYSLDIL